MKTLLVLRHAKTQPDAPAGDHARALTERGHRDAATIATHIRNVIGTPDAIVTSDATRARQTATIVATALQFPSPPIEEPRIYNADVGTLMSVVRSLPEETTTVIIIGHNPGFEELAASLGSDSGEDVRLPTAGLAILDFDVTSWSEIQPGSGKVREITSPKKLSQS